MSALPPDRLERLLEVGRSLVTELEPEQVLQRILEEARALTGARYAAVGVLDESRSGLERFLTAGIDRETHEAIGDLPRGHGVLGVLISDPKPLRLEDVGSHPDSYGFPIGHPRMHTFLGVPIVVRGEAWGNIYLTEKADEELFTEEDEASLVVLADWAAIAIENARAYEVERARREQMERANRALRATAEIARALGGETELERILELIAKRGRALISARVMVIELIDGDDMLVAVAAGAVPASALGERLPLQGSLAAEVIRVGQPRRFSRALGGLRSRVAKQAAAEHGLVVPLSYRGRVLGVMAAFDRLEAGPDFSSDDERLMEAFAASAATAVATGQHVAQEGARRSLAASEQERSRWARELHDDTLQDLAALRLAVSSARQSDDLKAVRDTLDEVRDGLTNGINSLRALISDLRPASLDELGTGAAVEALVHRVAERSGLEIAFNADLDYEQGRSPARHVPEIETATYRLVQEALTNIVKHAEATRVEVDLKDAHGCVELIVRDDGRGYDTSEESAGFGLIGMRERAELLGGQLEVESEGGRGTTLHARIPVRRVAGPEPAVLRSAS